MPYPGITDPKKVAKMEKCVAKVMKEQGVSKSRAIAICRNSIVGKENEMPTEIVEEIVETKDNKENVEKDDKKGWVPWSDGITSFSDLDAVREAEEIEENVRDIMGDFQGLTRNIMYSDEIADKGTAIKNLADEFSRRLKMQIKESEEDNKSLVGKIVNKGEQLLKKVLPNKESTENGEENGEFLLWKEADGSYRWIARYSNNFRDDDNPQEIISAKSHQRFVEKVDSGEYPFPKLQIWHEEDWVIGKSTWVAYDDAGFAVAAGEISSKHSDLAETLINLPPEKIKMSHGMPYSSIVRDADDETVIIEHQTKEITILPAWAAANRFTGFVLMNPVQNQKEEPMIQDTKKNTLNEEWNLGEEVLSRVETLNTNDAAKAHGEEIESKEVTSPTKVTNETEKVTDHENVQTKLSKDESSPTPEEEAQVTQATEEEETPPVEAKKDEAETEETAEEAEPLTREEVADGILKAVEPLLQSQSTLLKAIESLTERVDELSKSDDEKIKETLRKTPTASLPDLIARSVIGNAETYVDGRTKLGKAGPDEAPTPANVAPLTGVSHLDHMIGETSQ